LPEGQLSVYALHPVVALELASSGHVDGLAVPFFALALTGMIAGRSMGAGIQVALAALAKLQAACIAPLLLIMRRGVWASLVAAALVVAAYLTVAQTGFLAALGRYAAEWSFNSAAFDPVDQLAVFLRTQLVEYANRERGAWGGIAYQVDPRVLSRALLVLVCCVTTIGILRVRASMPSKAVALCAAALLLGPTAHPWYCVPLVAALTVRPVAPLLLLTGSLVLSYEILPRYAATGLWEEQHWVRIAEYAPALAWLSALLLAESRRDRSRLSGTPGRGESHAAGQDAA
jgi:Gpi18-like mannosyltransferase